jgi:hypothetical protein
MAYDGIQNSQRIEGTTQRQLYTKVVDQVLNSPTYAARAMGGAEPFEGKTEDITLDVTADTQGQWFTGLETLNSSATSTTVTSSYAHTAFTIPVVSIMLESFANVGSLGIINLDTFKYEKAAAQAFQAIGSAFYGTGTANQPLGLEAIVDAGTNASSIGGLSRSTYTVLDATVNAASSNKLTLAQMATLHDSVRAAGMAAETPNIGLTTKTVFSLYEQLLSPNVRATYDEVGYDRVLMKSKYGQRSSADIRNSAGFNALSYRNLHLMDDDFATSGVLYFLNEDYIDWFGRYEIPDEYKDVLEKVSFGNMEAYEGTGAMALEMPSEFHGWFYQKPLLIPEQAGRLSRFYVIGQLIAKSFRRQGKMTGITGV